MANPRRNSQSSENPFNSQNWTSVSSKLTTFLKRPQAFPFLLSIFLLLTYVFLRFQRSSPPSYDYQKNQEKWTTKDDDKMANLVRFKSQNSQIVRDIRGWLLDPISLALENGVKGFSLSLSLAAFVYFLYSDECFAISKKN